MRTRTYNKTYYAIKSKEERQAWWDSLTLDEQNTYIEKRQERRSKERRQKSIELMKKSGLHYNCEQCLHYKTDSCIDNLPNGCEYYLKATS